MRRKVIAAQRLFSLKCRYPTAGSVYLQFLRRRIEAGFSSGLYDSLTVRKKQGKPIAAQALFHRYYSTANPLLKLIDTHSQCDIIQVSKMQTPIKPSA